MTGRLEVLGAATRAEIVKLTTLPSVWIGSAVALLLPPGLTALNLPGRLDHLDSPRMADAGLQELTVGVIGVVVLAATAMSSEFSVDRDGELSGRGLNATLTAVPRRWVALLAKTVVVALWCGILATVATTVALALNRVFLGAAWTAWEAGLAGRSLAVVGYQVAMGLLSFAITAILRNGVVPVIVLAINSSVASFSYLISRVTPVGFYFPDMAGMRTFLTTGGLGYPYGSGTATAVLIGWVVVGMLVAAVVFVRRDA